MITESKKEIIKLNIAMTYPVSWSPYRVASNFVQNFYDALGKDNFGTGFHYHKESGILTMSSESTFSKDWLLFVGASSKRNSGGSYAGGFGEGFKMASLVSIRDMDMSVTMESADWMLRVTSIPGMIGSEKVDFLAYEVGSRPYQNNSVLRLENITDSFFKSFESVLSSFYYEGNKLFGKCIIKTDDYAIFEANRMPNETFHFGHLFASYEKRRYFRIPLVICNHHYCPREDDRDRDEFTAWQTKKCIIQVFEQLDAPVSFKVLEYFRPAWGGTKRSGYREINWSPVVETLIYNIGTDPNAVKEFQKRYIASLVYRDTYIDEFDRSKRKMALLWFQQSSIRRQYRYTIPAFRSLGIRSVCDLCQEMDGYTLERCPDEAEQRRIVILKKAAQNILGDLILVEKWPGCQILLNSKVPVAGYTKISNISGMKNRYGLKVVAKADYVYLQSYLLGDDMFSQAFATYAHELLHEYGGDTSIAFHRALSVMNRKIVSHIDQFSSYEEEWIKA